MFTPIRTPVDSEKGLVKTEDYIKKECAKKKYFALLSKELETRFHLTIDPFGWPTSEPEIYFVYFLSEYPKWVDSVDEARELIVDVVSFVLSYLNENPEITPFLSEHPFSTKNMFIHIIFVKNHEIDDAWGAVNLNRGRISYSYIYGKVQVPPESFEEAKAIVDAKRTK